MSSPTRGRSGHPLVERFRQGGIPEHLKSAAARGALPLPPEDMLEILFTLRKERAREIQQQIVQTVTQMPERPLLELATDPTTPAAWLDFLARAAFRREPIVEAVVTNPSVGDATLRLVAEHGSASLVELVALNQVRLTRDPTILQALLKNKQTTASVRRRLKEIWDLHQEASARARVVEAAQTAAATPAATPPGDPASAAPDPATPGSAAAGAASQGEAAAPEASESPGEEPPAAEAGGDGPEAPEDLDLEDLADLGAGELDQRILEEMEADDASEEELRLAQRLLTMTVPEKVGLALTGNREARSILIRDSSSQVQSAVINSPKMTEDEIEKISKMRSVSEDVLRMIANNREFCRQYGVIHNLVRNPKSPQTAAMQLMQRLQSRDLQFIAKDKNIPDIIRRHALITLEKRKPKTTTMKKK